MIHVEIEIDDVMTVLKFTDHPINTYRAHETAPAQISDQLFSACMYFVKAAAVLKGVGV